MIINSLTQFSFHLNSTLAIQPSFFRHFHQKALSTPSMPNTSHPQPEAHAIPSSSVQISTLLLLSPILLPFSPSHYLSPPIAHIHPSIQFHSSHPSIPKPIPSYHYFLLFFGLDKDVRTYVTPPTAQSRMTGMRKFQIPLDERFSGGVEHCSSGLNACTIM